MKEVWKDVVGYEGFYQVSNLGRVKSFILWNGHEYKEREKPYILSKSKTTTGYYKIELVKDKKRKSLKVHRLVAQAFIPNYDNRPNINHKDFNPLNNNVDNLEWCTQQENIDYSVKHCKLGTIKDKNIVKKIVDEYNNGKSRSYLVKKYKVKKYVIDNILTKYNVRCHGNRRYNINLDELKKDFDLGIRNKDLEKKYNVSKGIIAVRKYQYKKGMI